MELPICGIRATLAKRRLRLVSLMVSVLGLGILGSQLGIGFLANTGVTPSAGSAQLFSLQGDSNVPAAVTSTFFGPVSTHRGVIHAVSPGWEPAAGSAGSVTTGGDLAIVDTRTASTTTQVSVYVTNLAMVDADYSSFALPIEVLYASDAGQGSAALTGGCSSVTGCDWQPADGIGEAPKVSADRQYLVNAGGKAEISLPAGAIFEIAMPTGGSYFCTRTSQTSTASLQPAFFLSLANG